jgi:hypothetical protein
MPATFPCPNPTCTHAYSPAELQSASSVTCPKCGFVLKGSAPAKTPTAPPKPAVSKPAVPAVKQATPVVKQAKPVTGQASPTAKVAMAMPVPVKSAPKPPTKPVAVDVELIHDQEPDVELEAPPPSFPDDGPLIRTPSNRRPGSRGKKALLVGFALILSFSLIVVAGWFLYDLFLRPDGPRLGGGGSGGTDRVTTGLARSLRGKDEEVFKVTMPPRDWKFDNELRTRLNASAAFRHKEQDLWFAIVVKDYDTLRPRESDMIRTGVERLESLFGEAMELDTRTEPASIGKLPGQRLKFKGQLNAVSWWGECYLFFNNGFGYWFLTASPDLEVAQQLAGEMFREDGRFGLLSERKGWREQPPPTTKYAGGGGTYTLTTPEGVWSKHNAKNEDEKGDLFLKGTYPQDKDNSKSASLLVVTMDKQDDLKEAMKLAKTYLEDRKKEENPGYKLAPYAEGKDAMNEAGVAEDVGNVRGRVLDLQVTLSDEPVRYWLIAVGNDAENAYIFRFECQWRHRQLWRQEFIDLLRTLKIKKAE